VETKTEKQSESAASKTEVLPAAAKSKAAEPALSEPAVSTSSIKAAANSLHHFDAPPASGAPKELELLLHGKPNQNLVFGMRREIVVVMAVLILLFVCAYYLVDPGYTH
jgi:hypothetical protein